MTDIIDKLFGRTEKLANGCWEWLGSTIPKGYGQIKHEGKSWMTHRLAFTLVNGPIPKGLLVLHTCDNPCCINPEHLFVGTYQDNKDDCMAKGRHAQGTKIGIAKLDPEKVAEIRRLLKSDMTQVEIAERFGVGETTIISIKYERTWLGA